MGKLTTAKKMLFQDRKHMAYAFFRNATHCGLTKWIPDKQYLKIAYKLSTGNELELTKPVTFNEKLQWLKLYDRKSEYTMMVDKYSVRKYIEKIGKEFLIPLLGRWDNVDEIDFNSLPNQFVLKCNHDSGSVIICKEKKTLDIEAVKHKLEKALRSNGYWFGREWPYKNVKPCIIAEQYMVDDSGVELNDYKFYCFNGKPMYCQVISDRFKGETIDFYDMDWKRMEFTGNQIPSKPHAEREHEKPITFDEMKSHAVVLSQNLKFSRIDFYCINGKTYFGEITLFPASGFGAFYPSEWNEKLGQLIEL